MALTKNYRHYSFDLDGTLVHTKAEYRYEIVPRVIRMLDGKVPERRAIDAFWFEAHRDEIIRDEFGVVPEIFWPVFHQHDTVAMRNQNSYAYPEVEQVLRNLRSRGKIISIITGAPSWIADMEVAKLNGIPFNYILTTTGSRFPNKPNPASFSFVLQSLDCLPSETIYIGNSTEDAQFASGAGVDFIYLERREHEFHGRDSAIAIIHSLTELLEDEK